MMRRVGQRFRQGFRHENGFRFSATLQPVEDMKIYADDYFPVRQILRVYESFNVNAGDVVTDPLGQHYLLGEMDVRVAYSSFRCYPLNKRVPWQRESNRLHPLTQEPVSSGLVTQGHIWVLSEVVSREARTGEFRVNEEVKRVLTGADVRLNDVIDGERVTKIHDALGIKVLEVV